MSYAAVEDKSVVCPSCKAAVGEPCVYLTGRRAGQTRTPHSERWYKAYFHSFKRAANEKAAKRAEAATTATKAVPVSCTCEPGKPDLMCTNDWHKVAHLIQEIGYVEFQRQMFGEQ